MSFEPKLVKCSKCDHIALFPEWPKGRDFFQNTYISSCIKECGNTQSPCDASMRGFGGDRPFVFVEALPSDGTVIGEVLAMAGEAS